MFFNKFKNGAGDYSIPMVRLDVMPEDTPDDLKYLYDNRVELTFDLPLSEVVFDFFDKLKSATHGYASLDYEISDYKPSDMVKVDMLLNGISV